MYAPEIVEKRLKRIAQRRGIDINYHSIKQVDEANAHFAEYLKKEDFNPDRDLDQDEKNWIRNEHTLSMCDYRYWLRSYCWIVDKTMVIVVVKGISGRRQIWSRRSGRAASASDWLPSR
jgi:hypothetical protein